MAVTPATLQIECRNCHTRYTWSPYYETLVGPSADFDSNAADANMSSRHPICPNCESWSAKVVGQTGGTA